MGEIRLFDHNLVHQAMEKVKVIWDRLKTTQIHQKSYADVRQRELNFDVGDWVFLKLSHIKGIMRFGRKKKLNPHYVGST